MSMPPVRAGYPFATPSEAQEPENVANLTARQQEILQLLLRGLPNKVIARALGISPNTVKVHVHAIFRELKVHSRIDLAMLLWRVPPACYQRVKELPYGSNQRFEQGAFRFGAD